MESRPTVRGLTCAGGLGVRFICVTLSRRFVGNDLVSGTWHVCPQRYLCSQFKCRLHGLSRLCPAVCACCKTKMGVPSAEQNRRDSHHVYARGQGCDVRVIGVSELSMSG